MSVVNTLREEGIGTTLPGTGDASLWVGPQGKMGLILKLQSREERERLGAQGWLGGCGEDLQR